MKLQNVSLTMANSNHAHTSNVGKDNKTDKQNSANVSLTVNSSYDKMIERIREQIKKISENEHYDNDTKKSKIEELEKQIKEIEKMKTELLTESVMGAKNKTESKNISNNSNEKPYGDGIELDLSFEAKSIIETGIGLDKLKNAYSLKKKFEGEAGVLKSEIKIDKGWGLNTKKKEEELARVNKGIDKSLANMGEAAKNVHKAAKDMPESSSKSVGTSGHAEENAKLTESAGNVTDEAGAETAKQDAVS